MAIIDRKEREKEEMRRRILDSAKHLFLELGYEKTTIRAIAKDIEYSPATIYLYFKDKNELFFALHREAFQELSKTFINVAHESDPLERLILLGNEYLKFALENPELYELMFLLNAPMETLDIKDDIWEDGRTVYSALEYLITDCKNAGHFKDASVQELSMMIWATVHGLATIHLRRRNSMFEECERESRVEGGLKFLIEIIRNY